MNTQKPDKKMWVINIDLSQRSITLLALVLLMGIVLLGVLTTGRNGEVSAAASKSLTVGPTGLRQFYATKDVFQAHEVLTACASGYHMASLWEILNPSNLEYNTTLGLTLDDSGQGPPTANGTVAGWVRTGSVSDNNAVVSEPGMANCGNWSLDFYTGTTAWLNNDWTSPPDVGVWTVRAADCAEGNVVWCVED